MRLTNRCTDLLRLLVSARWLTTSQIHRRFFADVSLDAARKRLRKLTNAKHLVMFQENRMSEALFRLGTEGKRILEARGADPINLERGWPKQLEHVTGVNDLRIAAENAGELSYFFSYWELPGLGWHGPLIPDAIFSLGEQTFAAEYDRGVEGIKSVLRGKMAAYKRGLDDLAISAVIVVADRKSRMDSLLKTIAGVKPLTLFTTIDLVNKHGLLAPIFIRHVGGDGCGLF
jgi:hypothetical protein